MTVPWPDRSGELADVPPELKALDQWVVWKAIAKGVAAKPSKLPFVASRPAAMASSTDPRTWGPFDVAAAAYARDPGIAGVGFVFAEGGGLVGLDLDDSLDAAGRLLPWARAVFDLIGAGRTYGEVSPSLKGVKVIAAGELPHDPATGEAPKGRNRRRGMKDKPLPGGIELYPSARFFAVTGRRFSASAAAVAAADPAGLSALYAKLAPRRPAATGSGTLTTAGAGDRVERCWRYLLRCPEAVTGNGGHDKTLRAACECLRFDLTRDEAFAVMRRWSEHKSGGEPWSDREIEHKLASAERHAGGERGVRLRQQRQSLTAVRSRLVIPGPTTRGVA